MGKRPDSGMYAPFDRKFLESDEEFTVIGSGALGGKALGLASIKGIIDEACPGGGVGGVEVGIPRLAVLATENLRAVHGAERPL